MVADESDQTKPKSLVALIEFVEEGEREVFELDEVMTVIYSWQQNGQYGRVLACTAKDELEVVDGHSTGHFQPFFSFPPDYFID